MPPSRDPDGGVEGIKAQSGEITAFLRKWLVDHVMKADMLLRAAVPQAGRALGVAI